MAFKQATTKPAPGPHLKPPSLPGVKELVSLRIDRDVLDHFQDGGPGWQERINDALRKPLSASSAAPQRREGCAQAVTCFIDIEPMEIAVADDRKKNAANKEFKKARQAEDGRRAMMEYENTAVANRAKTARLKALRLARDAEEAAAAAAAPPAPVKKKSGEEERL